MWSVKVFISNIFDFDEEASMDDGFVYE